MHYYQHLKDMKVISIVSFFVAALFAAPVLSQTQQGYVKTKGRLASDGTVISGSRISGATVQVKGRSAVLSQSNGTFSFPITSQSYYLQSVKKQGYVLTDPDVLSKQYAYSKNPLVLVLETPSQQLDDKLAMMKKIRRTLQRQLQDKEDEIESLKEQQKLTEDEYRRQLQEIFDQQENNEKLISEMADRYSRMDFDEVDEFNRRISQLILDGKLTEADSLLNTKGDINARAAVLRQHQEANAQVEQEIKMKQKKLEKSKALAQKELDELAQDCYSKFEIFKMQHQNDSAAYYIQLRAKLDSTNIEWQLEAGDFIMNYLANYELTGRYYNKALRQAMLEQDSVQMGNCYNNFGTLSCMQGDLKKGLEEMRQAITIHKQIYGEKHPEMAIHYNNLGYILANLGEIDKAKEYIEEALSINMLVNNGSHVEVANSYNSLGMVNLIKGEIIEARILFKKSLNTVDKIYGKNHPLYAVSLDNIGQSFLKSGDLDSALVYHNASLEQKLLLYNELHPDVASSYLNIGGVYLEKKEYKESISFFEKAKAIFKKLNGDNSPNVALCYNNIGRAYEEMENYDMALSNYNISLSINIMVWGDKHPRIATNYNNIGSVLTSMNLLQEGINYYQKALLIRLAVFGDIHPLVSLLYSNIAAAYHDMNDTSNEISYYKKALESLPTEHPQRRIIMEKIDLLEKKEH